MYVKCTSDLYLREGSFQTRNVLVVSGPSWPCITSVMPIDFMQDKKSENAIHPFLPKFFDAERKQMGSMQVLLCLNIFFIVIIF